MSNGKNISQVAFACDVCRVHLCRHYFNHTYDHRKRENRHDNTVVLK